MRKSGFWLFVLLSVAAISVAIFGASMMAQDEAPLLLFTRSTEDRYNNELYLLNAATGEERLITDLIEFSDAGWTPDGRIWVVESVEDEFARRLRFFDAETLEESIFEHRLSYSPCYTLVYWSPNGEQMAYVSTTENDFFLNMQNLADGSSYQLGMEEYETPQWSPDSQYLYLGMDYVEGELFLAEDGSLLLEQEQFRLFSPDSRYISYRDETNIMYLYEIATGEITELAAADYGYWSTTGRYFMLSNYEASENRSLVYYDSQNQRLETITLDLPIHYAVWTADESGLFLFLGSDDDSYFPTRLLYYDLASQSSTTILEDTTRVASVIQNGDWFAISYNTNAIGDPRESPNYLLLTDRTLRIELEAPGEIPSLSVRRQGEGFVIDTFEDIRYFDTSSQQFETIHNGEAYQLMAHENYLAFIDEGQLGIWHQESRSIHFAEEDISQIIGWQGSPVRQSLLYCGEG